MKRVALFLIFGVYLTFASDLYSQKTSEAAEGLERPKLVVGIVVDQMRWDYLYRYYDRYGDKGFKRMLREGFTAESTYIDYVPTVTGIGHATVYTGSVPSLHGIAGNNFIIEDTGENIYCASDPSVSSVGSLTKAGEMSPVHLLTTTLGDELKLATNFRSKVIGIALKDRGAILPAGRSADAAYWYDIDADKWITSSWYMSELPKWVKTFNKKNLLRELGKEGWNTLHPLHTYTQSSADDNPYEGKFENTKSPTFPVDTKKLYKEQGSLPLLSTPIGNTITLEMAKAAIEHEALGQDAFPDLLAMSFSSTDWIGHQFGPNSIEIEEAYLRLDQQLGEFYEFLDDRVGKGEYTVFLTADHGGAHNVNFLKDHKIKSGGWEVEENLNELNAHLKSEFKVDDLVQSFLYYQVHFDNRLIESSGLDREKIAASAIEFLKGREGIAYVVDMEKVMDASIPQLLKERIINGYHHGRSGSIQVIVEPAWYYGHGEFLTGTDHSSWNPYDSHIPLLFMGAGVNPGRSYEVHYMSDIASTISALLKIQEPNGNIGRPITEVLK